MSSTSRAALVRAAESALTIGLITFIVTLGGLIGSVDLSDHAALTTALTTAGVAALVAVAKQLTGFTFLTTKPPAS